jgi:Ca2+-binding EF-hand superfamily protein
MGVEVITKPQLVLRAAGDLENHEYDELVTNHWGSIPLTMLTLIQFATVDSVGSIYVPMCRQYPLLTLYFVSFLLLVTVCLMNLVTAVIVESSLSQAAQDKEVEKLHKAKVVEKLMPKLREMFKKLDSDGNGDITLAEFGKCDKDTREKLCNLFDTDDLVELFEILDVDDGGSISIDEFCDELTKLAITQQSMDQIRLMKQMNAMRLSILEQNKTSTEMMQMIYGISEGAPSQGIVDTRLTAVENKLTKIDRSLFELTESMRILCLAHGKSAPERYNV